MINPLFNKSGLCFLFIAMAVYNTNVYCVNSVEARSNKKTQIYCTTLEAKEIKNKLETIVKENFDVELNNTNISINFHEIVITADNYLKNKLYTISSFLTTNKLAPPVIIATWKDLNSNYIYKAALAKDDLIDYNKGRINYETLFSKIKIVKSQINRVNETLDDALQATKLRISPQNELEKEITVIPLRPKLPPEKFYTPILKPLIHDDFQIEAKEDYVIINIFANPDEDNNIIVNKAFVIMKRVMGVNPSLNKIIINWQSEECAYGKTASLAGIYFKDFFNNKITSNEMKSFIMVSSIEPESRHLNQVEPVAKIDVPVENLRKCKELREAANIYRDNNKLDSAIRTYKQAIKFNPNDFLSYYYLGEIFAEKNEFKKARDYLNISLGLNPDFKKADELLARIKYK